MTDFPEDTLDMALSEVLNAYGDMVTRWVLTAEVITDDGERNLWTAASPDLMAWDAIGMLAYALEQERAQVRGEGDEDSE